VALLCWMGVIQKVMLFNLNSWILSRNRSAEQKFK